ncbi:MAG: hypothetical protein ABEL97_05075 [Salinibacter sp.]
MSEFTSDAPTSSVSDLTKRVRYSTGLVLGVDEFNQDQAYLMERDRLLTRALHGYGVVQGLPVDITGDDDPDNPAEVTVGPGLAVAPSGQHVCVERSQCAVIRDWLAQQHPSTVFPSYESSDGTGPSGGSGSNDGGTAPEVEPKEVCLSVVLRYGTCETDFVPIPGEPCRSAEETRVASRLADDFSLTLVLEDDGPPQHEEQAVRLLGRLLRALERRPDGPTLAPADLQALVRHVPAVLRAGLDPTLANLKTKAEEAPQDGGSGGASPIEGLKFPDDGEPLARVAPGRETEMLRVLETAWVTHARRAVLRLGRSESDPLDAGHSPEGLCQPVPKRDDGVVLGGLCLTVEPKDGGGLRRVDRSVTPTVSTDDRPRLLASRVLQETGVFDCVEPGGTEAAPDTLSVEEVAETLPTLPFASADLVDPARLGGVDASAEEVAIRIRFHLNTHETVTTQDNAYDVGEDFSVQVFSERDEPMSDYLYLTKESVQDRARLGRNVYVLLLRRTSVQNRPRLRLRFDLSEMTINQRAANDDGTRGEVTETFSGIEWVEERPVKWVGHDGTQFVTVFAGAEDAGGDLNGLQAAPRVTGLQGASVAPDAPTEGDHLVYDGTDWRPEAASTPQPEPAATNAETGLTRIVALNWLHGGVRRDRGLPSLTIRAPSIGAEEGQSVNGLAVAFGGAALSAEEMLATGTDHDIQADTLTRETFRVYTRQSSDGAARVFQVQPRAVLPMASLTLDADGRIAEGRVSPDPDRAVGGLFLFRDQFVDAPSELGVIDVQVRGDGVTDVSGRAVDAELVRGTLPTGDRPSGHDAGVQGGTFESWFYLTEPSTPPDAQVLEGIFSQNSG